MRSRYKRTAGFTLIELIITLCIFTIFTGISVYIVQSVLISSVRSNQALRNQIALRQALLTITREIRSEPNEDLYGPIESRYKVDDNNRLIRNFPYGPDGIIGTVIANGIEKYPPATHPIVIKFSPDDDKTYYADIYIRSVDGYEVSARIRLRINL